MIIIFRSLLTFLLFAFCTSLSFAQEEATGEVLLAGARYRRGIQEVSNALHNKNYTKAEKILDQIKSSEENDPVLLNLRGAIYSKKKDWDQAEKCFDQALEVNPNFYPALFNVGEIKFLQGNYHDAAEYFEQLLRRTPRNELLLFKVFLSHLLAGEEEQAGVWLERIPPYGDTPAWFYAHSAWNYKHENRRKGKRLVSNAQGLFGKEKTLLFDETFEEAQIKK